MFPCVQAERTQGNTFQTVFFWAFVCSLTFTFFGGKVGQDKLQAYTRAAQHPHAVVRFLLLFKLFLSFSALSHFLAFPASVIFLIGCFISPSIHRASIGLICPLSASAASRRFRFDLQQPSHPLQLSHHKEYQPGFFTGAWIVPRNFLTFCSFRSELDFC